MHRLRLILKCTITGIIGLTSIAGLIAGYVALLSVLSGNFQQAFTPAGLGIFAALATWLLFAHRDDLIYA